MTVQEINETIKFFEDEIIQYNTMLKGVLTPEYRRYIERLIRHYAIAIQSLNEMLE